MRMNHFASAALILAMHAPPAPKLPTAEVDVSRIKVIGGVVHIAGVPFTGITIERDGGRMRARVSYVAGLKEGRRESWWPNGQLAERRFYHHGLEHGSQEGWWQNGEPRYRYSAVDGAREGVSYEWHRNGQVFTSAHYGGGKEEGLQESWAEDGTLRYRYWQRDGRKFGQQGTMVCRSSRDVMKERGAGKP